jgi:glycosyltransferase involved in cell wall biosynthesis
MIGRHPGCVTTQGEIVSDLLLQAGLPVASVSEKANRYHRLLDIIWHIVRWRNRIRVQCLQVYSGPSFVVEDIASMLGKWFGHRIVMHLHGGGFPDFIKRHPRWSRRVLRRADALVAPSTFLTRAVTSLGFQAEVIPNVVELGAYPYRYRPRVRPRMFWMRSFHHIYNPLMAVKTLHRVRQFAPDATLVMGGQEKGMMEAVRQEAVRLGLADAMRLPGFLDQPAKWREGEANDIYLNTNRVDNTPVAVLEAAAMGLPVVSTNVGGLPDLLTDGETGLLVPDDDDAAMARAVQRLVESPELSARLSARGRQLAEGCSWENVRPKWQELFGRLLRPAASRGSGTDD